MGRRVLTTVWVSVRVKKGEPLSEASVRVFGNRRDALNAFHGYTDEADETLYETHVFEQEYEEAR